MRKDGGIKGWTDKKEGHWGGQLEEQVSAEC